MHRRDLFRVLGATAILPFVPREADAAVAFGRAVHRAVRNLDLEALSEAQARVVTALADLILPRTDTPGAVDVDVTGFIDHLLAHWYPSEERQQFQQGLDQLLAEGFADLAEAARIARLTALDGAPGEPGSPAATVERVKALTIYGYFTSERVVKEVVSEPIIPGRFEGCVRL